jgi:hypothetical protein
MSLASAEAKLFETPVSSRLARSKTTRRSILLLTLTLLSTPAIAQVTPGTSPLSIAKGGTGQGTATLGFGALAPSPTRPGDIIFWNGSAWITLPGNNSGTQVLSENASGVPSWSAAIGGVTSFNSRTGAVVPANGDYSAAQVTYNPVGTGGVATTVAAELNRTIWANDYGAVCSGTTNDTAASWKSISTSIALSPRRRGKTRPSSPPKVRSCRA